MGRRSLECAFFCTSISLNRIAGAAALFAQAEPLQPALGERALCAFYQAYALTQDPKSTPRVRELHVHGGSLEGCGWRLRTPTTLNITLAGVALAGDCMQPLLMAPEKVTALVFNGGSVACAGGACELA